MEKILTLALSLLLLAGAGPVYGASKEDLAALERQAKEKEAQLKKYKQQEAALAKELKNLTLKERQAQQQSVKLSADIEVFKTQTNRAKEHKDIMEENLPLWQSILQKELTNYIVEDILNSSYYNSKAVVGELNFTSLIQTHIVFLDKLAREVEEAESKLETFQENSRRLMSRIDAIEQQKQNIQGNYKKTKENLEDTHQRAKAAEKDLRELKESAAQMQSILKAAEARRKEAEARERAEAKKTGAPQPKIKPQVKKNTLMWPVSGKIISKFGKEYNAQLKTWIFRDGIKIAVRAGTPVEAVKDGSVIYAGQFRSYGNVVILDHGGGFFTIYGFLSEIKAAVGQDLTAGSVLGLSGRDSQGSAMSSGSDALYFEVRTGTTAENPELWLE